MAHHHLLVLLLLLLLLLLDHQQLIVVLLLLLAGTHRVIGLGTMVRGIDQSMVGPRKVQGLLIAPCRVVHAHAVLLLVHLLLHVLLLLLLVVLHALLLCVLLLGVYGWYVKYFVFKTWCMKCLQVNKCSK